MDSFEAHYCRGCGDIIQYSRQGCRAPAFCDGGKCERAYQAGVEAERKRASEQLIFLAGQRARLHLNPESFHPPDERCPRCDEEDALPKGPDYEVVEVTANTVKLSTRREK